MKKALLTLLLIVLSKTAFSQVIYKCISGDCNNGEGTVTILDHEKSWNNGEYKGSFKNRKFNGKGLLITSKGRKKYFGDFVDGKKEGNGHYYASEVLFYVGEWSNDTKNGKGIKYHGNGNVRYEGDFIDDLEGGNGKTYGEFEVGLFIKEISKSPIK